MRKKAALFLLMVLLLCLPVVGCGSKNAPEPQTENDEENEPPEPEPVVDERITVEFVDPVCVSVNNIDAARPQSGLQNAGIVYEFLVEGGITRLLAVFNKPAGENFIVGPVRSLRPYFAETAMEYGGAVAYSGMSERTARMIRHLPLKGIISEKYYWRDRSRVAPHNLYTDIEKLYEARGESGVRREVLEPLELPAGEEVTEFEVVYNGGNIVRYCYDAEKNAYLRYQNGAAHTDRETGEQYTATRVIVRKNRHTPVDNYLVDIDLDGSGTAVLYEGGRKYDLTWEKQDGKTVYCFADGKEVDLRVGNTWIQVVPL